MVVDLYEPQYLALIVFGGFVALSFVVYAFSAFGIQEKSYEQAVAEQRARLEKEQIQQREAKRQKRKPFFEKKKREREKHDSSPGVLQQEVVQAVDSYDEDAGRATPPPDNVKSSPVKQEKAKPEKVKPSPKKPKQPKQPKQVVVEEPILEVKKTVDQQAAAPPPPKEPAKTKAPKVVEEKVQKKEAPVVAAAPPPTHSAPPPVAQASPAKAKNKSKASAGDGDSAILRGKSLIAAVKTAPLKDAEIQQLIEILLNRQGGSAPADDWVKANQRNDPVSALKKQLQEKEQALHNEMLLAQSANQKVKELRHELNQQKERSINVEGQYKMKLDSQVREIEAFHVRMQQSHEAHSHETQALQTRLKQLQAVLDESNVDVVNQLREENNRLKSEATHAAQQKEQLMGAELARLQQELQKMQSKLSTNEAQLRQGEELRRSLEAQVGQYKQQRDQIDAGQRESETALSKRLSEVSDELRKAEERNQSLVQATEAASLETEKVKGQLNDMYRLDGEKNNSLQAIQAKLKESECKCQNLEGKVRAVENQLVERDQQKSLKDQEIKDLKKEMDYLQGMLQTREKRSEAEGQEAPPPTNGDVNHTDSTPKEDTILLKEHNSMLADKTKTIEALEGQLHSSKTQLKELQDLAEQQKQRNNEEMATVVRDEQTLAKNAFERIFPSVKVDASLAHKDWLSKFEEEATEVLNKQSSTSTQLEEHQMKISTLEAEKDQLSSQCQHYQSVLADTEGMVNKLQKSVESEEAKYEGRIRALETEKQKLSAQFQKLQNGADGDTDTRNAKNAENSVRIAELEKEKEQLLSQFETLQSRVSSTEERSEARIADLEKEKTQLLAQCQQYQVVLKETEGILNKLQNSVESEEVKWEEKVKVTEANLGQAKDEIGSLQAELDKLMSSKSETSGENSRLSEELAKANATIEALRSDQETAASSYDLTSRELEELKKQLQQLQTELEAANQLVEQSHDKEEENAETKSKLAASEAEVKRLSSELDKAKAHAADLQSKASSLPSSQEVDDLKKQLAESQKQLAAAQSSAEEAQKQITSLKEQLAASSSQKDSSAEVEEVKGQLAAAQAAKTEAEGKAAAKDKEIESLNANLKKEKVLTQDLGKAAAKLQAMLKKTQSALNVEKETVAKLKMQNGAKEGAKADGTGV